MAETCGCGNEPRMVAACSGASNLGALADQAARLLQSQGTAKMFCLMGVGGKVAAKVNDLKAAKGMLVIDGCAMDCARLTLEEAGFKDYKHLRLTDLGMKKGETGVGPDSINQAAQAAKALSACC
jgi:uncharacterized metal-binding protein